ncbi:MAG: ATP-binding cassette domain-containing protein, partial [Nitriliruptorales bacterium]|nr:ATP-binding cassette domain-containing protein [Nitriliruptorales bacterium]
MRLQRTRDPAADVHGLRLGRGPGRRPLRDAQQLRRAEPVLAAVGRRAHHGHPRRARIAVRVVPRRRGVPPARALPQPELRVVADHRRRRLRAVRPGVPAGLVGRADRRAGTCLPVGEGPRVTSPLLQARGLDRWFGGIHAVDDVTLDVEPGALHAVIGPNGSGKTTLFNLITGHTKPSRGSVVFEGRDITGLPYHQVVRRRLAKSYQITTVFPRLTVFENVRLAAQSASFKYVFWRPAGRMRDAITHTDQILERVGLGDRPRQIAGNLSHGDQRRLDLAVALATSPRLLL